jgi:hypothetical protein
MTMSNTPDVISRAGFCLPFSDAYNISPLGEIKVIDFLTLYGTFTLARSHAVCYPLKRC